MLVKGIMTREETGYDAKDIDLECGPLIMRFGFRMSMKGIEKRIGLRCGFE